MRCLCVRAFLLFTVIFFFGAQSVKASIEDEVKKAYDRIQEDWESAENFTCGGLVSTTDERVLASYARRKPMDCIVTDWCSAYDKINGACIGQQCRVVRTPGVPDRTRLYDCSAGTCTPVQPSTSCEKADLPITKSYARHYECNFAKADCYSFIPNVTATSSYYPFAYNCSLTYRKGASPVDPKNEPKGEASIVPPYDLRPLRRASDAPWIASRDSNASVLQANQKLFPTDSSLGPLRLDNAAITSTLFFIHPTVDPATRVNDEPNLLQTIGRMLQPPEVRLILPHGGVGLNHVNSPIFQKLFPSLRTAERSGPVEKVIGDSPDALKLAADYLRSIPLLELRYEPIDIRVPTASEAQLTALIEEWKSWTDDIKTAEGIDANVTSIAQENIAVLESYRTLHTMIRDYRAHFPSYLHALLTYTEEVNRFFDEYWIDENVRILDDWYATYTSYLPTLQASLRQLYSEAAAFTSECLVPACRLEALPVKSGTQPWVLAPDSMELTLSGDARAWLPRAFPLWEDQNNVLIGGMDRWHPETTLGQPLPDITLDLSELYAEKAITVPVLTVDMYPVRLPYPPLIDSKSEKESIASLTTIIRPLPRLPIPKIDLEFPTLVLPDPASSLFVMPEPPFALSIWKQAIQWRLQRMKELRSICDQSGDMHTFLVHEFLLYGSNRDPTALRAAALVPGIFRKSVFSNPAQFWPFQSVSSGILDTVGSVGISLQPLTPCPTCPTVRPQRFIRQHLSLDASWEDMQRSLIRAVDEWNAQVTFTTVISREEIVLEQSDRKASSGLREDLVSPLHP